MRPGWFGFESAQCCLEPRVISDLIEIAVVPDPFDLAEARSHGLFEIGDGLFDQTHPGVEAGDPVNDVGIIGIQVVGFPRPFQAFCVVAKLCKGRGTR